MINAVVSYAKRGMITAVKSRKVAQDVTREVGYTTVIRPALVERLFLKSNYWINDSNVPALLGHFRKNLAKLMILSKIVYFNLNSIVVTLIKDERNRC